METAKKPNIALSDLCYYFDSKQKDSIDVDSGGRKSAQLSAIRQNLLALSEDKYHVAVEAIQKIVQPYPDGKQGPTRANGRIQDGLALFNKVKTSNESVSTTKVAPV